MAASVTRALQAIKRYNRHPDQIDSAILAAINITLCLASNGDDRVAEGFNQRYPDQRPALRHLPLKPATAAPTRRDPLTGGDCRKWSRV